MQPGAGPGQAQQPDARGDGQDRERRGRRAGRQPRHEAPDEHVLAPRVPGRQQEQREQGGIGERDERAHEQHQRRHLRGEHGAAANRQRSQDPEVALVGKERRADEQRHERAHQHRHAEHEHVVAQQRAAVRLGRGLRPQHQVLVRVDDHHQPRRRHEAADAAGEQVLQRIGAGVAQDAEVEQGAEEMPGETPLDAIGESWRRGHRRRGHRSCITSRIWRATGAKSLLSGRADEDVLERLGAGLEQRRHVVVGDDAAVRQDHDPRTQLLDDVEAVRAEKDHAAAGREHAEQRPEEQPGGDVEAGERLVQHQQIGVVHQGRGQEHALPHPLGVDGHRVVAAVPEQEQLQQRGHLVRHDPLRHPAQAPDQRQILDRRQVGVEVRLLGHVADPAPVGHRIHGHRPAVERHRSRARLQQADDGVDRGALARSVRPQVAENLAAAHLEIHAIEREEGTVSLCQSMGFEHRVLPAELEPDADPQFPIIQKRHERHRQHRERRVTQALTARPPAGHPRARREAWQQRRRGDADERQRQHGQHRPGQRRDRAEGRATTVRARPGTPGW